MNSRRTLVDFDGTLIFEISSREFEQVFLTKLSGPRRRVVEALFFGKGLILVHGFSRAAVFFTNQRKDWRFVAFVLLLGKDFERHIKSVVDETASRLTLNTALVNSFNPEHMVVVVSCGLADVIGAFLSQHFGHSEVALGSHISVTKSGRARPHILQPSDKVAVLQQTGAFDYFTDDVREAELVAGGVGSLVEEVDLGCALYHVRGLGLS